MRIPPNTHPTIRIRNALIFAASLMALWMLICLTSCSPPRVPAGSQTPGAPEWSASSPAAHALRTTVTRFTHMGPIPLARPFAPMHARFRLST